MITNEEKIEILINKINNIDAAIQSFINNAEICKDKYSLEDELLSCNLKKQALINQIKNFGGSWPS